MDNGFKTIQKGAAMVFWGLEGIRSNNGNLSQNTQCLGEESDRARVNTNTKRHRSSL